MDGMYLEMYYFLTDISISETCILQLGQKKEKSPRD